jgi:imidazole glycerol-phosphate synthase subunit HisF
LVKRRIIPVVLLKNGRVVQSKGFKRHQVLGVPSMIVGRLTNWFSDELIFLDISRTDNYDLNRDDLNFENIRNLLDIVNDISKKCFMPLTVGGGIRCIEDIELRLKSGADKVTINKMAIDCPEFIRTAAEKFGSQCIVISIDAKRDSNGGWEVFSDYGKAPTGKQAVDLAIRAEKFGAGEILINSIDEDGKAQGFDIELIKAVVKSVRIPVIALGGAGSWEDFEDCINQAAPSAVSASNIFQYSENSVYCATKYLFEKKFDVRKPQIKTIINSGEE